MNEKEVCFTFTKLFPNLTDFYFVGGIVVAYSILSLPFESNDIALLRHGHKVRVKLSLAPTLNIEGVYLLAVPHPVLNVVQSSEVYSFYEALLLAVNRVYSLV